MAKTKLTTDELLSTFEEMTVLELKEFLDAFEEKCKEKDKGGERKGKRP
jgi:ribosomal protein L7/L12